MGTTKKKSTVIVNQYQYTDPLMVEVQDALAAQTYKNYVTLIIIGLICIFFTYREYTKHSTALTVLFAIVAVISFVAPIVSFTITSKRKKEAIQNFRDTHSENGYDLMITIEGKRIRTYCNNAPDMDTNKDEIYGCFESERFFVFQLRGDKLLPLKKDAFIQGDVEMCRNYIPELKKK